MSKRKLRELINQNKKLVNDKSIPINPEDIRDHLDNLKTVRGVLCSPTRTISTSKLMDMVDDTWAYIVELQNMIKLFRRISYLEDHSRSEEITEEEERQYNKIMNYDYGNRLNQAIVLDPNSNGPQQEPLLLSNGLTREELDSLIAAARGVAEDIDMPEVRTTRDNARSWLSNVNLPDDERLLIAVTLEAFDIEHLRSMLEYSGLVVHAGPSATTERDVMMTIIANNPSILERWLNRDTPNE